MSWQGLSRWGRAGLALLLVHIVLLFLPPIPPDTKGSLWSFLAGYSAVALLLVEFGRQRSRLAESWGSLAAGRGWAIGLGVALATLALALSLRHADPTRYARFARENGLWEPVTLFCYLASAILLFGMAGGLVPARRRHARFIGGLYVLMGLEEVDYFGVFGGMIGRVQGMYAGSLHDLVPLAVRGALSPTAWATISTLFLLVVILLWWSGYLQPRALLSMIPRSEFVWVCVGVGFLLAAAGTETGLFQWAARPPAAEEALELIGGICLFFYALSLAAGRPALAHS